MDDAAAERDLLAPRTRAALIARAEDIADRLERVGSERPLRVPTVADMALAEPTEGRELAAVG